MCLRCRFIVAVQIKILKVLDEVVGVVEAEMKRIA